MKREAPQRRRGPGSSPSAHRSSRQHSTGRGHASNREAYSSVEHRATRSSRSWARKPNAQRTAPDPSVESRLAQPIQRVVPLDLSFGNFEFQESKSLGKRGGGVRELSSLLRQARRKAVTHADMLHTRQGVEMRSEDLLAAAMQRAAGLKVKDDPTRIAKALAKRRSKKRQSAKQWAKRMKHLEDSVENVVKDRSIQKQTVKARKEAKARAKVEKHQAAGSGAKKDSKAKSKKKVAKKEGTSGGKSRNGGGRR